MQLAMPLRIGDLQVVQHFQEGHEVPFSPSLPVIFERE